MERRLAGSEGIHAIGADGSLIITTNPRDLHGVGIVRQASNLSTSSELRDVPTGTVVDFRAVPTCNNEPRLSSTALHGLLDFNQSLFWTINVPDSDNGQDYPTQGTLDQDGQHGLYRVEHAHHDKVGGYLALCPSDLDGTYLAGRCGPIGIGTASGGPALYAIQMDPALPASTKLSSKTLLEYGNDEQTLLPLFNGTTKVHGCAWIETEQVRGVVFSVTTGTGDIWYGRPYHGSATKGLLIDPYGGSVGYHSTAYEQQLWVYDPDELRAVLNGETAPDAPRPVNIISLGEYEVINRRNGRVGLSFRSPRLTITLEDGYREWHHHRRGATPLVLEFGF